MRVQRGNDGAGTSLDLGAGDALRQAEVQSVEVTNTKQCEEEFSIDELRAIAMHMGMDSSGEIVDRDRLVNEIRNRL